MIRGRCAVMQERRASTSLAARTDAQPKKQYPLRRVRLQRPSVCTTRCLKNALLFVLIRCFYITCAYFIHVFDVGTTRLGLRTVLIFLEAQTKVRRDNHMHMRYFI